MARRSTPARRCASHGELEKYEAILTTRAAKPSAANRLVISAGARGRSGSAWCRSFRDVEQPSKATGKTSCSFWRYEAELSAVSGRQLRGRTHHRHAFRLEEDHRRHFPRRAGAHERPLAVLVVCGMGLVSFLEWCEDSAHEARAGDLLPATSAGRRARGGGARLQPLSRTRLPKSNM